MFRRSAVLGTILGLAASGLVLVGFAPSAGASPVRPAATVAGATELALPFGAFSSMVVDQAAGRVFYSGLGYGLVGGVVASSLTGTDLQIVTGTTDARGTTVGPDGLVYATEDAGDIVAIDPTDLTVAHTYSTGAGACPSTVAFAGTELWFSFSCGVDATTGENLIGLGEIDRTSGTVTLQGTALGSSVPQVTAVPGHPDRLVSYFFNGAEQLDLLQVAATSVTSIANTFADATNVLTSPDGSAVLANGQAFSTTDLSPITSYATPDGVPAATGAFSADGANVATSNSANEVTSFQTSGTLIRTFTTPSSGAPGQSTNPAPGGLAWVGSTLLSVYADFGGGSVVVDFLADALQAPSTLTVTAPVTTRRGVSFSFSGRLTGVGDTAGLRLSVSRRDASGLLGLPPVTVGAGGVFRVVDTPPVGSTNVYTVSFAGNSRHGPARHAVSILVSRANPGLTVRTDKSSYPVGAAMTVTAHLGAHYNLAQVSIYATVAGTAQRLLGRPVVDAHGNAVVRVKYSYSTSFAVTFGGDYRYLPAVIRTKASVAARVTVSLRGGYGTSGSYRLYYANSYAGVIAQVLPAKAGACAYFIAQYYTGGRWLTGTTLPCGRLNTASVTAASFSGRTGVPWRGEVGYHGESRNAGGISPWLYVRFA